MDIVRNPSNEIGPASADSPRSAPRAERVRTAAPAVDVFESQDALLVLVDLPGVESSDVAVRLEKDELSFTARRRDLAEPLEYRRGFAVPPDVDGDAITASLDKGVLSLRLPRKASARPRQIPIQAS
jgi:HSP20 family molecular chaperone IbpA